MAEQATFFLHDAGSLPYAEAAVTKFLTPDTREHLAILAERMEALAAFDHSSLEEMVNVYLEETGLKFKALAQPIRVAITGTTMSPGLFETMEVLGRERTLERFRKALTL
jgi:glutamyl-tRNA synthetase